MEYKWMDANKLMKIKNECIREYLMNIMNGQMKIYKMWRMNNWIKLSDLMKKYKNEW